MRDGWLFEPPNPAMRHSALRTILEKRLEMKMMRTAQVILTATEPISDDLRTRYPDAAEKIATLTNGYDRHEFEGLHRQRESDGQFLLVYTGALSSSRQGVSVQGLFEGLALFSQQYPEIALRLRVIGDIKSTEQNLAKVAGIADLVTFLPAVSRREAHQHQLDADALLLVTTPGHRSVATLKLFDYIGAGVPIFALAAGNAAAEIVQHYDLGVTVSPDDAQAIAQGLAILIDQQHSGKAWPGFRAAQQLFERRALTGELALLLEQLIAES